MSERLSNALGAFRERGTYIELVSFVCRLLGGPLLADLLFAKVVKEVTPLLVRLYGCTAMKVREDSGKYRKGRDAPV